MPLRDAITCEEKYGAYLLLPKPWNIHKIKVRSIKICINSLDLGYIHPYRTLARMVKYVTTDINIIHN